MWPLPDATYTVFLSYHRQAPKLVDTSDTDDVDPYGPITTDGPVDELPRIPDDYARTAIYEGALFLQARDNANIQDQAIQAMLKEYIKGIVVAEGPTGPTRLVPYGRGRY